MSDLKLNAEEANRAAVLALYDECLNEGKMDTADRVIAPGFVTPSPGGATAATGPEGFKANVSRLRTGFPDIHFTVHDVVAENDRVALYWTWDGTHRGSFVSIPPTGRRVHNEGLVLYRFEGGKIVEAKLIIDRMALLQQLGARPPTPAAAATAKSADELNQELRRQILALPGVSERQNAGIHEDAFVVAGTMFMHIHGHGQCDIRLPKEEQARALAEGRAQPHRWAPEQGYVTACVSDEKSLGPVMELIRLSHRHFAGGQKAG